MRTFVIFLLLVLFFPGHITAQTSFDLRGRIKIDGYVEEYSPGEWILDEHTAFPESPRDSHWGLDNEIRRIALTWDSYYLYAAVDCAVNNSTVMIFIDCACGGPDGLQNFQFFRRNIAFNAFTPNVLVKAWRGVFNPEVLVVDCDHPPRFLNDDDFNGAFYQNGLSGGGLEIAVPWKQIGSFIDGTGFVEVPVKGQTISVLAVITGGEATGSGDSAPDPSVSLADDSTSSALLDNFITIELDADADKKLDMGVSPREAASCALSQGVDAKDIPELSLIVDKKIFAPDSGEKILFKPVASGTQALTVQLSASVYSASGRLVRVIYSNESRVPQVASQVEWDEWDGKDAEGRILPGGIYILTVSEAIGGSDVRSVAKEAIAVIR